ncbi:MAG: HAD family hydrolase [Ktedonobacteraceae bacterium]|nr:HAD family hydrolase [Ktedonobacteraceae bacterium]
MAGRGTTRGASRTKRGELVQYLVLACDYDGTLAKDGIVGEQTLQALERVVASGRKLMLVTGRILEDLECVFPRLDLFTYIVAENGALLYHPASSSEQVLAEPPPERFVSALQARGVPLQTGHVIVATSQPHQTTALEVIREQGLERQVIFNKGSVMILPTGINKGSGLIAALNELKCSPHNVVGVGDAENDHSFLDLCECAVAVANALPAVKERADYTTQAARGEGVSELIEMLLADDLQQVDQHMSRHALVLGQGPNDEPVHINARHTNVFIVGPSGSGKSTMAMNLLEQLVEQVYQFCLIDPEGDYETFQGAITLGDTDKEPGVAEVIQLLEKSEQSAIVNLLGSPLADRPAFFRNLLPALQDVQTQLGHPHWLILDEAHHLFPPDADTSVVERIHGLFTLLFISAHPDHVSRQVLALTDVVIIVGEHAPLPVFAEAVGQPMPEVIPTSLDPGEVLVWFRRTKQAPVLLRARTPKEEHTRHRRKYAEGDLPEDISFYFRGPQGKLRLRAQNLILFTQIAEGIDDETWLFHLRQGDYSRWFREVIKDEDLAAEAASIEKQERLSARESRSRMQAAIEERYTLP